jgi:hypothetical protein
MDLLNIESEAKQGIEGDMRAPASIGDRIWALVDAKFPYGSFTSSDILELYEDTYNEPIKLSIISTYLSRYAERGRLERVRQGKEWVYRASRQPAGSRAPMQPSPSSALDQLR